MNSKDFFETIYSAREPKDTRAIYDEWSETYDASVNGKGYATPARCAAALASFAKDKTSPILDFGCGTGISGLALRNEGFTVIDGCDLSQAMIAKAKERNIYRNLWQCGSTSDFRVPHGPYSQITAVGAIGLGAAPIDAFDVLFELLPPGGSITLSFNDHTLKDPHYEARIAEYTDTCAGTVQFKEYGEHLPGLDINSTVYVIAKK